VRRPLGTLLFAAALATVAASSASLALLAVAIGLVLLTAAAGMAVALAGSRLTVARTIVAREVQQDASIRLQFSVQGTTYLPVRLEIEDHTGGWVAIEDRDASLQLRVARCGAHSLAPSRLRLRDALGIFERRLLAGRSEPLLILPTPQLRMPLHARACATDDDPEPQGLQPYTPGTALAHIHWPTLARGAGLQVRQFAPSPNGLPLVVVDTAGAPSPQARDWAARTAAGYILTFARNGGCRVLLPGDTMETSVTGVDGGWRAIHRRLAMIEDSAPRRAQKPPTGGLHVRATAAPAGLTPAPPLPSGVLPRSP
jgi:uncharacterized protein (DUF58 family)